MTVTDAQVAALRAFLVGNSREHSRLVDQLDRTADRKGYTHLIGAAFFDAVYQRFAKKATAADVIRFVGDVRATTRGMAEDLDASAAERLIKYTLGVDVPIDDIDANTAFGARLLVLGALIADEQLDDAGLDAFLAKARASADEWLSKG